MKRLIISGTPVTVTNGGARQEESRDPNHRSDHTAVDTGTLGNTGTISAADQTAESAPPRFWWRLPRLRSAALASPDGRNAAASGPTLHSGNGAGYRRRS